MAYANNNYPTKKALKLALKAGKEVKIHQPGPFPLVMAPGIVTLEGPHYPAPHSWYARVRFDKFLRVTEVIE